MSKVLFSSITKKFTMALAGLFMLTFLPLHLFINLMLLKSEPGPFNTAAHFMATFPVIKIIEVVLFAAILIHISYGIWLQIRNWLSKASGICQRKQIDISFFSKFMIWTGAIILTFLILHWFNFYFIKLGIVKGNPEDFYSVAHNLFKIPAYDIIYLSCFALLGFHLFHAFYSAFQTLGLNHRIWSPVVKVIAFIYAVIIPAGFAFISITLWLFR